METITLKKPLRIRVAEALGDPIAWDHSEWEQYRPLVPEHNQGQGISVQCPGCGLGGYLGELAENSPCPSPVVALYETDWSVTGPLIEKYEIALEYVSVGGGRREWVASLDRHCLSKHVIDYDGEAGYARRPLTAVCELLVELGKNRHLVPEDRT